MPMQGLQNVAARWMGAAPAFAVSLFTVAAQAAPLIVGNSAPGPIVTWDFANGGSPVGSFGDINNLGRGVAVLGNKIYYYTEGTDSIRVAPFNGGAGGADITSLTNPRPGSFVLGLAVANGVLYAYTGYPDPTPQVFGLNPMTGAVVSGPVSIAKPANPQSSGFTVLPNGNFLINNDFASCTYNQYNPATGAVIPGSTPIVVSANFCTGVDTNGTSLYFRANSNSFKKTDLSGFVLVTQSVTDNAVEDISLVGFGASGQPGKFNCSGKTVSDLANQYGTIDNAASSLLYPSVTALQNAIKSFCAFP